VRSGRTGQKLANFSEFVAHMLPGIGQRWLVGWHLGIDEIAKPGVTDFDELHAIGQQLGHL